jgi:hypothetical protein
MPDDRRPDESDSGEGGGGRMRGVLGRLREVT